MKALILLLAALANCQATAQKAHSVTVRFASPVPNAAVISAIQVYRSQSANLSSPVLVCNLPATATTCTDGSTNPNKTYWFYAVSVGTVAVSPKSNVSSITVKP